MASLRLGGSSQFPSYLRDKPVLVGRRHPSESLLRINAVRVVGNDPNQRQCWDAFGVGGRFETKDAHRPIIVRWCGQIDDEAFWEEIWPQFFREPLVMNEHVRKWCRSVPHVGAFLELAQKKTDLAVNLRRIVIFVRLSILVEGLRLRINGCVVRLIVDDKQRNVFEHRAAVENAVNPFKKRGLSL